MGEEQRRQRLRQTGLAATPGILQVTNLPLAVLVIALLAFERSFVRVSYGCNTTIATTKGPSNYSDLFCGHQV